MPKTTHSVRLDATIEHRIKVYATANNLTASEAIRDLIEKGLACQALSVFATPLGELVRDCMEAEFNLMRDALDEHEAQIEERVARVCSRGTKASLHTAMQLNDMSRALIPAWRDTPAEELWGSYSRAGGELQAGIPYADVKAGLR